MKNIFVLAISSLALSGFSFTTNPGVKSKKITTISASAPVQQTFGYFRAHRQGKGISLSWGITSPANVSGFSIEWSDTGEPGSFIQLNTLQRNSSLKYAWKHDFPFAGYNHYRIGCVMDDGSVFYSNEDIVRIVQH